MNSNDQQLSGFMRFVAFMTGRDPDILFECGQQEYNDAIALFIIQMLSASLIFLVASYGLSVFFPGQYTLFLAGLVTLLLFFFDRAIINADWELKGILAGNETKPKWRTLIAFAIRFGISALVIMGILSLPLDLRIQQGQLDQILQANHQDKNQEFFTEMARFRTESEAKQERQQTRIDTIEGEIERNRQAISGIDDRYAQWLEVEQEQEVEAHKELYGMGRAEGPGEKYKLAIKKQKQARQQMAELKKRKINLRAQDERLKQERNQARSELEIMKSEMTSTLDQRSDQLKNEGKFTDQKTDLMLLWQARRQLHEDPERGPAARYFSWMLGSALILLELMPLIKQGFFSSASVYQVRRITHTRLEAAKNIHAFRSELAALRHNNGAVVIRLGDGASGETVGRTEVPRVYSVPTAVNEETLSRATNME